MALIQTSPMRYPPPPPPNIWGWCQTTVSGLDIEVVKPGRIRRDLDFKVNADGEILGWREEG